jgi:hypothetical protein
MMIDARQRFHFGAKFIPQPRIAMFQKFHDDGAPCDLFVVSQVNRAGAASRKESFDAVTTVQSFPDPGVGRFVEDLAIQHTAARVLIQQSLHFCPNRVRFAFKQFLAFSG